MVIVTGSVTVAPGSLDDALRLALEHVHRSRQEPGCLQHSVHRDAEDGNRLFFFERWADRAAVDTHFAVPASNEFVKAVSALAVGRPTIEIYDVGG